MSEIMCLPPPMSTLHGKVKRTPPTKLGCFGIVPKGDLPTRRFNQNSAIGFGGAAAKADSECDHEHDEIAYSTNFAANCAWDGESSAIQQHTAPNRKLAHLGPQESSATHSQHHTQAITNLISSQSSRACRAILGIRNRIVCLFSGGVRDFPDSYSTTRVGIA